MNPLQSDSLDQLAPALVAAQAAMPDVVANETVKTEKFSYQYADLATIREAVAPVLAQHGLAVVQTLSPLAVPVVAERVVSTRGGDVRIPCQVFGSLRTTLLHASGQWIAGEQPIAGDWGDTKATGGAITYARRVGLKAVLGIAEVDNEGNAGAHPAGRTVPGSNGPPPPRQPDPEDDIRPGDPAYDRQYSPNEADREEAARSFAREEINARFNQPAAAATNGAGQRRAPPPSRPRQDVQPKHGPPCPFPKFPEGGFYGWLAESGLTGWFTALGQQHELPEKFNDWTWKQIGWACDAYKTDRDFALGAAAANGRN